MVFGCDDYNQEFLHHAKSAQKWVAHRVLASYRQSEISGGSERFKGILYVLLESFDKKIKGSRSEVKCAHAVEARNAIQRDRLSGSSAWARTSRSLLCHDRGVPAVSAFRVGLSGHISSRLHFPAILTTQTASVSATMKKSKTSYN